MEYNIKRYVKCNEQNVNGFTFEKESTNRALEAYINKPVILISKTEKPYGRIKRTDKIVGYLTGYDDEYLRCFIYEGFVSEEEFIAERYTALLTADASNIDKNNICEISEILKIAIWKDY